MTEDFKESTYFWLDNIEEEVSDVLNGYNVEINSLQALTEVFKEIHNINVITTNSDYVVVNKRFE